MHRSPSLQTVHQPISVLLRQQDRSDQAVGFGDDPHSLLAYRVGDQHPPPVPEGSLVLAAVVGVEVASVPRRVTCRTAAEIRPRLREDL